MFSTEEARGIATTWRSRFIEESAFEASWTRYFETATVPDVQRLEAWLAKDLAKDQVMHAGIVKEPILPTRSRFEVTDCQGCSGNRYVRINVPISDPRFGKALECPDCNGGSRSQVMGIPSPESPRPGRWCWRCRAAENEPPGENCGWPDWHASQPDSSTHRTTIATMLKRM